ncbi:MAG: argininosuccinate synthase [Candidatus Rokubacteria bacterium]|nr:argininosuccinate synthase [Candidatus Rokubacteria bacterium]
MPDPKRVVLAYSGGLDTSVILRWLIERHHCDVIAFCADLGQGEELIPIRDKALRTGASSVNILDLREEFVRDFIFPMLRANAVYEGSYLLGTSIARPLIARAQVDIALKEGADAVAHGATGKGNDQVRFELTYAALAPQLRVIAPWREWELDSRTALIEFARRHDIPVPVTTERPYSTDRNLFHISYEGGILEDPWAEPPAKMFQLTNSPEEAPDVPVEVLVDFERGDPIAVDGRALAPVALLTHLNRVGGEHGVGRVDLVENRYVGMKSRGVYETPGGTILHVARRALESLALDREVLHLRDSLVSRYAEMIYYGFWFSPERRALQGFMDECAQDVTGRVRLRLYKGNVTVAGRRSPRSLYRPDFATFEADSVYRPRDAEGFINLNALRLKIRALRDRPS